MKAEDIAKKRVKRKKKFFKNLWEYTLSGTIVLVINLLTVPSFLWSLIPISVFVILILKDFFQLYGPFRKDEIWEQIQFEKELKKLKKGNQDSDNQILDLDDLEKINQKKKIWDEKDLV